MQNSDEDIDDAVFNRLREEHQREIDLLSLELLSNSKQYKKFIAKNGVKNEEEVQELILYRSSVEILFMELLAEYDDFDTESCSFDPDLQIVFKECIHKMIQHIKTEECKLSSSKSEYDGEPEDDMLFSHAYPRTNRKSSADSNAKKNQALMDPFSYWGATIRKSEI
jgi:hypothetical protein